MNTLAALTDPAFWAMSVVILFFLVGFLGSFLPILPGAVIIWAGIIVHKLWLGEESISWTWVGIATGLMVLAQLADYACTVWGARKFGASWRGGLGALLGGILGLFIPPQLVMIFAGPFVGAVAAEYLGGSLAEASVKAGVGTLVGGLVAFGAKIAIGIAMILGFFILNAG